MSRTGATSSMRAQHAAGFDTTTVEINAAELRADDSIPSWLRGALLRNGPACFEAGNQPLRSWLDGLAMLTAFEFRDRRIRFRNRFLVTEARSEVAAGRYRYAGFGTGPSRSLWETFRDMRQPRMTDNANVNVAVFGNQHVALTETPRAVCFDALTLETQGVFPFEDRLRCMTSTPHPVYFPKENVCYNVAVEFGLKSHYHLYRMRAGSRHRETLATLPVKNPSYMHGLATTNRFVILCEIPFLTSVQRIFSFLMLNRPVSELYEWRPAKGTRFLLFDRMTGELAHVAQTEAFFCFHIVNAFEDNAGVALDATAYPSPAILDAFHLDRLRNRGNALPGGQLRRYRIPTRDGKRDAGTISSEAISDNGHEFPRINPAKYGRPDSSCVYACGLETASEDGFYNQLVKMDISHGRTVFWSEAGCYPGEPVFAASPDAHGEDEGVVLSLVLDSRAGISFLLILDAATFRELARVEAPIPVPFGFHGDFYADY